MLQRHFPCGRQSREHLARSPQGFARRSQPCSGVECCLQPEGRDKAMQYMANGLFARANQPLIVMLIERRKFNRDLLQGCDEWPWIRRDTGAGHRFGLTKTGYVCSAIWWTRCRWVNLAYYYQLVNYNLNKFASGLDLPVAHVGVKVKRGSGCRNRMAGGKPLNGFF
jgi:hypothetical protein